MAFIKSGVEGPQQHTHFHVLAVDDSLVDRKHLEKLLSVSSYQVTCVESGDKALEFLGLLDNIDVDSSSSSSSPLQQETDQNLQEVKVNLIMTDYCMPGMTGYDLLKRVKTSSWKNVPVVVMSSESVPSRINMCLEGGAEEFLLKPVQLSDVKKLQPHLIKSLNSTCNNTEDNNNDSKNQNNYNNNNNNNASKLKSMSPEPSLKNGTKMKGSAMIELTSNALV